MKVVKCPKCNSESFNRTMDAIAVDQAQYRAGRLEIRNIKYDVHESNIACARCAYEFDEAEHETLLAEIEELF